MLSLKVQALFWYKGGRKGSMVPSKMSIDWKDRATESERKLALLREVLLDVDALLNLGKRQADVVFARLRREDDPITKRIEDALLETAGPVHCVNWAYGCNPKDCTCRCDR